MPAAKVSSQVDLSPDPQVVGREAQPGSALVSRTLLGFLGESDRPGLCRLYLTPEFDEYYDIRADDVLERERLPEEDAELAGSVLRVKRNAVVYHARSEILDLQLRMLEGEITKALLKGVAEQQLVGWAIPAVAQQIAKGKSLFCIGKRESGGESGCTDSDRCTKGYVARHKCTHMFGGKEKPHHVTEDLKC